MNGLRPTVEADEATATLTRRRFARTRGVVGVLIRPLVPRGNDSSGERLELLWLPNYWVRFAVADGAKTKRFEALVCGHGQGAVAVDLSRQTWQTIDSSDTFAESLATTVAIEQAHDGLKAAMVRAPKWSSRAVVGEPQCELIGYPYWVYYYRRRGDKLDVRLLDAMTGRLAGPKAKAAFLAALAHQKRGAAMTDESPH